MTGPGRRGSKVPAHLFVPDPELPADHRGFRVCSWCQLVGSAGDARHTLPVVRDGPDVRELAAGEV